MAKKKASKAGIQEHADNSESIVSQESAYNPEYVHSEHKHSEHKHTEHKHSEHKHSEHKHMHQTEKAESDKITIKVDLIKKSIIAVIILLVIVVGIALFFRNSSSDPSDVAAKVNGEVITVGELNAEFDLLPESYKAMVTKTMYLDKVMITQKILAMQAKDVSNDEIEAFYANYLKDNNLTEDEAVKALASQGMSLEKFRELVKVQIYLNNTLRDQINVSEDEIREVYDAEKDNILDTDGKVIPYDEVKADIENFLRGQKFQKAAMDYVAGLRNQTNVEILYKESANIAGEENTEQKQTFKATGDELCTVDGKPVIRMYSTTSCPHCKWVKDDFDQTVKMYGDSIVAYHWELDTKDNTLTDALETEVPAEELAIYQKYNSRGSVPTFVFGCKYLRIGTGYEADGNHEAEKAEFRSIIESLIQETETSQ